MPQTENCIICGGETPYTVDTHIDFRYGYIKGMGQLCRLCYDNPEEKTHFFIPKRIISDTPNDQELGKKVRLFYYANNS